MTLEIPYELENFVGGKLVKPLSGKFIDNINPATGELLNHVADSDEQDVAVAVKAATAAFADWSVTPVSKRFEILNRIADSIDKNADALALAETTDNGKPLSLSKRIDIPRASANFRFFATGIMHFASESHQMEDKAINYTLRQPLGVVACISPWNLPLYLFTWKIAPALAAGNCIIAKPSEVSPVTAYLLSQLCTHAGLPAGVLNIIQGTGNNTGEAMINHPGIKAISFTGSTRAGANCIGGGSPL